MKKEDSIEILKNTNSKEISDETTKMLKQRNWQNNSFQWKSNLCNSTHLNLISSSNEQSGTEEFKNLQNLFKFQIDKQPHENVPCKESLSKHKNSLISFPHQSKFMEEEEVPKQYCKENPKKKIEAFKTAAEELQIQSSKKKQGVNAPYKNPQQTTAAKRPKFVSPLLSALNRKTSSSESIESNKEYVEDERLKNIDPKMVELIRNEIMDTGSSIDWSDIAGLESAKTSIRESVVWPMLRPDIFTGLRRPPKGILLFGPPGTGKTLIGKCIASQSKATFFSISASSLTSKWVGEGEKMVRALFAVARCHQPAVIFIDEIDSLLSQRSETENECTRRMKTEFLVQLDGATTKNDERLLLIGATNRPQELDEAVRRRLVKRLYIPLPEFEARLQLVSNLMAKEKHEINNEEFHLIAEKSDGYSGADIHNLCSDACLGPIRSIDFSQIEAMDANKVRPVDFSDFSRALVRVRSSVSPNDLDQYVKWNNTYGSGSNLS